MFPWKYAQRPRPKPAPMPVLPQGMHREFLDKPLNGGKFVVPAPDPKPPAQVGLVIPPPPWAGKGPGVPMPETPPDTTPMHERALAELRADEPYNPPPFEPRQGPPVPLPRFEPPKWTETQRRAEAERIRRQESDERALVEETPRRRPPIQRKSA